MTFSNLRSALFPLGAAVLLSTSVPASAQAFDSQDLYRYRVLGDNAAGDRLPMKLERQFELVPGSHAQYLIHHGRPTAQAIAEARSAGGEEPSERWVERTPTRTLSGYEAYQRWLGHGPALRNKTDVGLAQGK